MPPNPYNGTNAPPRNPRSRMNTDPRPIAVYHEHPDWFRPLFAEMDRRGLPYVRLDPRATPTTPAPTTPPIRSCSTA